MWLMTAMGTILATISKWIHGDIPIQAEILAIKIYLEMTYIMDGRHWVFSVTQELFFGQSRTVTLARHDILEPDPSPRQS